MIYGTAIKVADTDEPRVTNHLPTGMQWVYIDGTVPVFCDNADTADRIAQAFAELARLMRAKQAGVGPGEAATDGEPWKEPRKAAVLQADVRDPARTPDTFDEAAEQARLGYVPVSARTPAAVWFIERGQPEHQVPTVWWAGHGQWTTDANEAIPYPDRAAAESVIWSKSGALARHTFGRATEHVFLPAAPVEVL